MKLPRRAFLHLAAGAAALPAASRIAYPQSDPTGTPSEPPVHPLAEGLAAYADGLRYDDIDAATIERVKTHVIDTIGCGIGAFDERPVSICRNVALAVGGNATIVGTDRRTTPGWDPPVMSLPAVALAAGKLMKLGPDRLAQAVNLAVNDHIPMAQTRVQTLSDWKGFADAEAARNAVFAALLARGGLTGPAPIFEGQSGFFKQVSGPANIDPDTFGRRGVPFRIHRCAIKPYPAVIYTQTAIVAGIEVAREVGALDRIAAIEIATTSRGYQRTGSEPEKWSPKTRETADHSLPYITARAMFDGDITNESFAPHMFSDPNILAFMQKITVSEDPNLTARVGAAPTRVTAILADGQRISREVDYAPGFAERPMNRSEVERKFRGNVGKRWPQQRTDATLQALWALDQTDDLSVLLGRLSMQANP